jgi:hypothetical protein
MPRRGGRQSNRLAIFAFVVVAFLILGFLMIGP